MLRSLRDDVDHPVTARLLIGRSPACGLRLDDRHVSGEHATLSWTGRQWEIRDLGSRNGTYVDGAKIEPGATVQVAAGAHMAFGDPQQSWALIDDEPPSIMAVHAESQAIQAGRGDLLVLPNPEHPEVSIYEDATGWWVDAGDERPRRLEDRGRVQTSVGVWTVQLPSVSEGTPLMRLQLALENVDLLFEVSRDEERVHITLVARGVEIPIPPREHGYVLLTLARARAEDEDRAPDERGWRDRDALQRMLALDANALNVAIHRARQQMSSFGLQGAARLVEVRRRQRRLGTERFRIRTLEET